MTYKQTLEYLFSQLPMYQRQGKKAFKKDLTNIKLLCNHFENPQSAFPSIHIAGTNGKGTVAHMLAAIFQSAGLRVGLYTSPHYKDFRERIKINGEYIAKRKVSSFVKKVKDQLDTIRPSFFEITVAMAFDYFRSEKVDLAIIETGLGGRLDSTNIINPKLSVITNISLDHQSMLGNTIRKIAREKAGIIKKRASVIIGERQPETTIIFTKVADQKKSRIYYAEDLIADPKRKRNKKQIVNPYERLNSRTAKAVISVWNNEKIGKHISAAKLSIGIKEYRSISNYIGRWQVLGIEPLILADSAHNEGGISLLVKQILESNHPSELHIVLGFVRDKPLDKVLALLPKESSYYFSHAKIPRALPAKDLKEQASSFNLKGKAYSTIASALKTAKKRAKRNEIILVCGSIFLVAEVL